METLRYSRRLWNTLGDARRDSRKLQETLGNIEDLRRL